MIVHPNWWGQPPAILKGWVDRVFRPGIAYRFVEGDAGEGVPIGLLKASAAVVFNTSNTPDARERFAFGDPAAVLQLLVTHLEACTSAGEHLEALHLRIVRSTELPPQNVQRRRYQFRRTTPHLARTSWSARCASLATTALALYRLRPDTCCPAGVDR